MLQINKIKQEDTIIYEFHGSTGNTGLENIEKMLYEDMQHTYKFVFDFKHLNYMSVEAIHMLKKVYISSVDYSYEIKVQELNPQSKTMFEIFQVDTLYAVNNTTYNNQGGNHESSYSA